MTFRLLPLLLLLAGPAWGQGQESVAAPMGPQTTARPAPLRSSIATVSVPSGQRVEPLGVPVPRPEQPGSGLVLPSSVRLTSPQRLFCGEIGDPRARARCEALREPPAPPGGAP
ncbi:hypothetical protein [Sabulicella rubraurantiaca]|uniref:hypothetical protein n=1 Tax=Sabulicella rubraurantiaca TaxID=2811429 RepID=UPI001A97C5AA|nr:hypothetical protein [Sabulicella rubraurantiaca]